MTHRTVSAAIFAASLAAPVTAADLQQLIGRYAADRTSLTRLYGSCAPSGRGRPACEDEGSAARLARFQAFYREWLGQLEKIEFDALAQESQIDYLLLKNNLGRELRQLELDAKALEETAPLVPFREAILALESARRRMSTLDPAQAAEAVNALSKQIAAARKEIEASLKAGPRPAKSVANRAAAEVDRLRGALRAWSGFYSGYDPLFTWWVDAPYKEADKALEDYAAFLRDRLVGVRGGDRSAIVGNPIGRDALMSELAYEMIPYSPEELIEIANQEYAWCAAEMKKASRALGYGDEWHKALEYVKTRHVEPGKQPELIRELALQAIEFIDQRNLVTVPPLARETWRMEMMSAERQLVNPFFTGGEVISVSYPTNTMTHEQKLMSMRGNNRHFSHATVFHEVIPGHHLQLFMMTRYRPYRAPFSTAFLTEGWALYWEMLLWDLNFHQTPEDRVGALFWRMHRCARIIFSLSFHLGKMTPEECIEMLIERVGHERDNASAEVRRSFNGSYGPLYQAAYMLGGLQIRALRRELVDAGKMSDRAFHDAILEENRMPIEMIRASLTKQKLSRDFRSSWRFYEAGGSR